MPSPATPTPASAAPMPPPSLPLPPPPRARSVRHWPRELRDTLAQLAVIALTIAPLLPDLPAWCGLMTAGVLGWRAWLAWHARPLPVRRTLLLVLALALAVTFWQQRTLLGRDAGLTLLVVLMALKTLELRARRDALVVFFLGFFLVMMQCLGSQSLLTAIGMLLSTWGLLTLLTLSHMPAGRPPLWQAARVAGQAALLGLPVMAVLFLLFPRIGPLWTLPGSASARTGLSDSLQLGQVASLAQDDSIAFRVRFDDGAAPRDDALYFRGPVLSVIEGQTWQASFRAALRPAQPPDLQTPGAGLAYTLMLQAQRLPLLPLLEATPAPPTLDASWRAWLGSDLVWHTVRPVDQRLLLQARAWPDYRLDADRTLDTAERHALTRLPPGQNPRSLAWARALRQRLPQADAPALAAELLRQVRSQDYRYTLQPGAYGEHPVDAFWLDRRSGFCEHYAVAFVVLMRALDVPARIVTGYQGAEPPDAQGWRIVRQSHAHAWAEYWQDGVGWRRADPTAAVAPERVQASRALAAEPDLVTGTLRAVNPALWTRLRQAWESLDARWAQWVMGYSRQQQFALLRALGVAQPDWTDLLRLGAGLLAAAAASAALWAWRQQRLLPPWQKLQRRVLRALQACDVPAQAHQGPRTWAALLHQRHGAAAEDAIAQLLRLDQLRYGAPGLQLPPPTWWPALRRALSPLRQPASAARPGS